MIVSTPPAIILGSQLRLLSSFLNVIWQTLFAILMLLSSNIIADLTASINEHSAKGSTQDTTIGASNIIVTAIEKSNTAFVNFRLFLPIDTLIWPLFLAWPFA
jgi:hypothetical protein